MQILGWILSSVGWAVESSFEFEELWTNPGLRVELPGALRNKVNLSGDLLSSHWWSFPNNLTDNRTVVVLIHGENELLADFNLHSEQLWEKIVKIASDHMSFAKASSSLAELVLPSLWSWWTRGFSVLSSDATSYCNVISLQLLHLVHNLCKTITFYQIQMKFSSKIM